MYLHSKENSSHVWVSAASPSESESFDTKAFGYFRFLNDSARLKHTDLEDLRNLISQCVFFFNGKLF